MGATIKELYDKMIFGTAYANLESKNATLFGGDLQWNCHVCLTCAESFESWKELSFDYDKVLEMRFYIIANYLAYVPYGSVGNNAATQLFGSSALAERRFDKVLQAIGGNLDWDENASTSLKKFFADYQNNSLDLSSPKDVAILFCRVFGEIEANWKNTPDYDVKATKNDYYKKMAMDENFVGVVNIATILDEIAKPVFGDDAIAFVKSFLL